MLPYTPICVGPIWAQNCHVHPAPAPSVILMPSDNMASGQIPLGLQTQFKEWDMFICYDKKLISLGSGTGAYKRGHLIRDLERGKIILLQYKEIKSDCYKAILPFFQ